MEIANPTPDTNYTQELLMLRTNLQRGIFAILLTFLALFPMFSFANDFWLRLMINFSITIIAVLGLNLLTGLCGQGSIAQVGFMAIGAYTSVILTGRFGLSFWVALPSAAIIAGLVGVFFGLSAWKTKGLYLFLVTLGAHYIIEFAIMHLPSYTGGPSGIPTLPPALAGFVFDSLKSYYYIVIIVLIITILVAKNLVRTYVGRAWLSIRDKEIIASAMGIEVFRYKLLAFFIGCAYAGIAGSLWAHSKTWLAPEDFTLTQAIWFFGMIIVGGLGTILGSILGPIFLLGLGEAAIYIGPALSRVVPALSMGVFAALSQVTYAIVILLFLGFEPGGLVHLRERLKNSLEQLLINRKTDQ